MEDCHILMTALPLYSAQGALEDPDRAEVKAVAVFVVGVFFTVGELFWHDKALYQFGALKVFLLTGVFHDMEQAGADLHGHTGVMAQFKYWV
ncbi:MAG: hypothetical protein OIF34_12265, partial [Porticoccaceae bacterium]|nr:hypothetical protein [Porticoccaceae bacterium]